jgi:dimethylhistidine N-methyltransferase
MSVNTISCAPRLHDLHPPADRLYEDVRAGLAARPRKLLPKYFYDEAGALLFERITRLDDYYPTRTELRILQRHIGEIADAIGPAARILELGSGSGLKTRHLLRHLLRPASYMPVDISRAQLMEFATSIAGELPALEVLPVCADYTQEWTPPAGTAHAARTVAFFPGSTIGNFEPDDAVAFLRRVRSLCGPGGGLLIGVDLHKDRPTLERAYNDGEGVTAAFNLNLLQRINRECGADFDTGAFRHHAFYDERRHRIEMRLVSIRRTLVTLPARDAGEAPAEFHFEPLDFITTEYSHKYTLPDFRELARATGWSVERLWSDERCWFSVWLLGAPA